MTLLWRHHRTDQRAVSYQDVWGSAADTLGAAPAARTDTLVSIWAAHRLIVDSVVTTPLQVVRDQPDGTTVPMTGRPPLLQPPTGTLSTWLTQLLLGLLSDGNAFGLVAGSGSSGWPSDVVWVDPARVQVDETRAVPAYALDGRELGPGELVHIPWIVPPGRHRGLSPLGAFRTAWETGTRAQATALDWFAGGAVPSGHLRTDRRLDVTQVDAVRSRFLDAVRGRGVFVSGSDWSYSPIGVPAEEARWAEQLRLTATQVATVYGLAPEDIGGESGGSLTYATVEGNERRLSSRVIAPWTSRIEDALSAQLPRGQRLRFDLAARARPELLTRMQALEVAIRTGVMTLDEARESEGRAPLPEPPTPPAPVPAPEPPPPGDGTTPQDGGDP